MSQFTCLRAAVAAILKFMDAYAEPLASLGDLYYHRYFPVCVYLYVFVCVVCTVCMYACLI
jgi:hypothetical protein